MKLSEELAERVIDGMGEEEKKDLILKLGDYLITSLGREDRKELMFRMIPSIVEKMLDGLDPQEKAALVRQLMPGMMDLLMGPPKR